MTDDDQRQAPSGACLLGAWQFMSPGTSIRMRSSNGGEAAAEQLAASCMCMASGGDPLGHSTNTRAHSLATKQRPAKT
eukprot:CAMPEP_0202872808 /NCGR_PEP_ID=MMETSP1391-20130828/22058_1 /ASSEMBLY_ACC=CAM_ASM_000867 /TAXON_ID=1034604 /ORGANISM="Chlamydomonas leiostraca, Strain SAG 11-49" /LENGTH=77 /DNA_ID=CAMNT_0049553941 /DNA_START=157 /DNA_END=391 /DNA_ORIENTATION=-